MTRHLLDTNVISELRKPSPTRRVVDFVSTSPLANLYISTVTIAEIRFGIECTVEPYRRAVLERWLDLLIRPMFTGRTLELTEDVIVQWRILAERGRKAGRTFAHPDIFLAATALQHGLTIVTRNTSDFVDCGVQVLNPWKPQE